MTPRPYCLAAVAVLFACSPSGGGETGTEGSTTASSSAPEPATTTTTTTATTTTTSSSTGDPELSSTTSTSATMATTGEALVPDLPDPCNDCDGACELRTAADPNGPPWALLCGTGTDESVPFVATTSTGSTYVVFNFAKPTVGPVALTLGETFTHEGGGDTILARISPTGALEWSRSWGGSGSLWLRGISVAPDDRLVVTGYVNGSIVIDGQTIGCETCLGGLVVVLAPDGSPEWQRFHLQANKNTDAHFNMNTISAPSVGPGGEVAVAGTLGMTTDLGQGYINPFINWNGYLLVYEPDGAIRHLRIIKDGLPDFLYSVHVGPDSSLAITGEYTKGLELGAINLEAMGPSPKPYTAWLNSVYSGKWAASGKARLVAMDGVGNVVRVLYDEIEQLNILGDLTWSVSLDPTCKGLLAVAYVAPDRLQVVSSACIAVLDNAGTILSTQPHTLPSDGVVQAVIAPDSSTAVGHATEAAFDLLGPWLPKGGGDLWVTRLPPPA